jgi:hypothetical protein
VVPGVTAFNGLRHRFWRFRDAVKDRVRGSAHRRDVFEAIYRTSGWGEPESVSGSGSTRDATRRIRLALPPLLQAHHVRSLVDAPCGDAEWIQDVLPHLDRYVGLDIVPALIARNAAKHARPGVSFRCADITTDPLPPADLVLCRDCFIHLPTRLIWSALKNFRASGATFVMLTSNEGVPYRDIPVGSFRPLDLTAPPFSFPKPLAAIPEDDNGRHLALWRMDTLPLR